MKKVVFLTNIMMFGGAEKVIATLANKLSSEGVECIITTIYNSESAYELHENVRLIPLQEKSEGITKKDLWVSFTNLRKILKKEKPDIILAMPEETSCKAIPFMLGLNIPIVVSERNNPAVMPRSKITRCMRKMFYPFVDGIVFQTNQASQYFSKRIQKKGKVIFNPLDVSRIPKESDENIRNEIVSVGRLHEQKNHKMLIKAFSNFYKSHPEYKLLIYGDGDCKDELVEYANSLMPSEAYCFEGARRDVLECIDGARMFVLSSNYEGMPNALIEAMALGICCISTDCPSGGPSELIEDYMNGILIPVGDSDALEEKMNYVAIHENESNLMRENARNIRQLLDPDVIVGQWREYFEEIITK